MSPNQADSAFHPFGVDKWLQLDVCKLSLGRCHLVNAYEVKAGIGVIAGITVWSMPERLECAVLQKVHYIHTLPLALPAPKGLNGRCCVSRFTEQSCRRHHWSEARTSAKINKADHRRHSVNSTWSGENQPSAAGKVVHYVCKAMVGRVPADQRHARRTSR